MMAAAAAASLSRSRGVAGVRSTKGLFFTFTLLCLVCLASSLTDKDQLESMKENLHKHQQILNRLKEQSQSEVAPSLELLDEYINIMGPLAALMRKTAEQSPDFPPMEEFLLKLKGFIEKTKAGLDSRKEKLDTDIENLDQELGKMHKLIRFLEEHEAEL